MDGESLQRFSIYILLTVTVSQATMSPGPVVYVISDSNVTFSCTPTDNWKTIYFYDYGIANTNFARVIFQSNSSDCRTFYTDSTVIGGADKYSSLKCIVGQPVSIIVRYINSMYHNKSISCKIDSGELRNTTVKIREILTKPMMKQSGRITIKEKTPAKFNCTAKSIPKSTIAWHLYGSEFAGNPIAGPTEDIVISTFTYEAKKTDNNLKLFCSANDTFTTMNSSAAELNILYAPTVRIDPGYNPYMVYVDQQNVSLICVVEDANPRTGIQYKWNSPLGTITNETVLISTVSKESGGKYSCITMNKGGTSDNITKQVEVQFKPSIDSFNISIKEGNNLILTPKVYANPTVSSFLWTRNSDPEFEDKSKTLVINNIQRNASGYYNYHVMNTLTPSGMSNFTKTSKKTSFIDVQYVPLVHIEPYFNQYVLYEKQQQVVLACEVVDANPTTPIIFNWKTPNGTFENKYLTIPSVARSHKGMYSCTANNSVGQSVPLSTTIIVQYSPLISNVSSRENITEGRNLVVSPVVDALPAAELIWWTLRNNVIYNGGVLIITNIKRNESGNYSVHAMNTLTPSGKVKKNGTADFVFFTNVQYPPSTKIAEAPTIDVLENDNVKLHCTVIDANPVISSIMWYQDKSDILTHTTDINITNIHRSASGNYTCDARNKIGNGHSSVYINVLYGPDVNSLMVMNGSTVLENSTAVLKCEIDSNPVSTIQWTFNNVSQEDNGYVGKISYFTIKDTTCYHTGKYQCMATNKISSISYNRSKEVQLLVNCSPQLNIYTEQPPRKIGLPLGGVLDLNVHVVAYPDPTATWAFQPNGTRNITHIINGQLISNLFRHTSYLYKSNLSEYDFGDYTLDIQNSFGSNKIFFQVVPEGPPEPSALVNASCGIHTARVYWVTSFSGGDRQQFSVIIVSGEMINHIKTDIFSSSKGEIKHTLLNLSPGDYIFSISGQNRYNSAVSTNSKSCQVKDNPEKDSNYVSTAAAGGGVGAAVILIAVGILIMVIIKKRRSLKGDKHRDYRGSTDEDEDDGLKDNPLYGTSPCNDNENGPVYSEVKKAPTSSKCKDVLDHRSVNPQIKKNAKRGNKQKEIEMGSVYENSDKILKRKQTEDIYANSETDSVNKQSQNGQSLVSQKNKDGLIYADLELAPTGTRFVIRGIENRNNYAIIDLSKTAEPLPSDDEDVDEGNKETSTATTNVE